MIEIRQLNATEGRQYVSRLAEVLMDCVVGGASVSFMASLSKANQPHRADVAKLLVLHSARGKGIGSRVMEHAEEASKF